MVAEIITAALGAGNCRETFGVAWKVAIRPKHMPLRNLQC